MRVLNAVFAVIAALALPLIALADDDEKPNAYLEGYKQTVMIEPGPTTPLAYGLLIILAGVCVAALFKNARRSHLD